MKQRVEGHQNLYKDDTTGVITNRNAVDRDRYRIARQQAQANIDSQVEISELKKEVKALSEMREEMTEIKDLLKQLLSK